MAESAVNAPASGRTWRSKYFDEERSLSPLARRRLYSAGAILIALGLICFPIVLLSVLTHSGLAVLDRPAELWINTQRNPFSTPVMIFMTVTFGPVALPIIILVAVVVWALVGRHLWRPLVLGVAMISGVAIATAIAFTIQRHRPPTSLMLIGNDTTFSFPSGHILGASDFLIITGFLLVSRAPSVPRAIGALVFAWLGIFAEIYSRMYLGYHWLTDGLASLSISMVIVGVVILVDTRHARAGLGAGAGGAVPVR
jgi:membrane-associated phospholipid phosphatase